MALYPKILNTQRSFPEVPEERMTALQAIIQFLQQKIQADSDIRLLFVCTHNSRRSILSQVWAQTWAHHFGIHRLTAYAAGTETTEVYPLVLETLQKQGFRVESLSEGHNALSLIKYEPNAAPILGFSKSLGHFMLPETKFAAIMTCDHAQEHCPVVPGAEARFPLSYEDPKAFDGTPRAEEAYQHRSLQIAGEWYYIFHQLSQLPKP